MKKRKKHCLGSLPRERCIAAVLLWKKEKNKTAACIRTPFPAANANALYPPPKVPAKMSRRDREEKGALWTELAVCDGEISQWKQKETQ
jgi:hypothetical protein